MRKNRRDRQSKRYVSGKIVSGWDIHILSQGYTPLIKTYVQFILTKLRFHRLRPEFNGLFEYEEYVTLKGIDDPNEGYVRGYSILAPNPFCIATKQYRNSWDFRIKLNPSRKLSFRIFDIPIIMNVVYLR